MKKLYQVSLAFMKRSKTLTFSCFISVFIAVVFIISMYNFSYNAKYSYKKSLSEAYGDYDMIVNYENYGDIDKQTVENIAKAKGVSKIASGRFEDSVNIENNNVYVIGAVDSDMMKSRYNYTVDLNNEEIVINQVLAKSLNKKAGETTNIGNYTLTISEVFEDKINSANSVPMAILTQDTLVKVAGTVNKANFIMVKMKENSSASTAISVIKLIDRKLETLMVEDDPVYKDVVESFSIYLNILSVIVLLISGLFVTSIFQNFMYKYNNDMLIIRAIGGTTSQIKYIFFILIIVINGIACGTGYIATIFLNRIVLQKLNQFLSLIKGEITFLFLKSFFITLIIFIVLLSFLFFSLLKNQKSLPLQALVKNEVSKNGRKRKDKKIKLPLYKLLGKNLFLAIKFIVPKMKENLYLTLTIMMIVLFSMVGASLNSIIQNNNSKYIDSQYLTDIVVTGNYQLQLEDTLNIYGRLKQIDGINTSLLLTNGPDTEIILDNNTKQSIDYSIADIEQMKVQSILPNEITQENQIVLNTECATTFNKYVGDTIIINTPVIYKYDKLGNKVAVLKEPTPQKFVVCAVLQKSEMGGSDVFIDIKNEDFILPHMGMRNIYIDGDWNKAESELSKLKAVYPALKWSNYQEAKEMSTKTLNDRFYLFEIVIGVLIIIAGIGWFNSMRNIIYSRKQEYSILRVQGVSVIRLQIIISIQVLIYLFVGVVLGILVGTLIVSGMLYADYNQFLIIIDASTTLRITLFMFGLSILLYPSIRKVSKYSIMKPLE
ncbi:FtsX-like permease family protein [Anaerocolumna sp.]|uniref:FtsX-like permease family protein n=1 Tax=Anaerocolumna sp. TaxID=2041569 RepID=UPI0028B1D437|nr:FtsX-like permease family protein [Anaerocolumna sp.]